MKGWKRSGGKVLASVVIGLLAVVVGACPGGGGVSTPTSPTRVSSLADCARHLETDTQNRYLIGGEGYPFEASYHVQWNMRFRNACSERVHLMIRVAMFNRFDERTVAASSGIFMEAGETRWVCDGHWCTGYNELREDPSVTESEFPIRFRAAWRTCGVDEVCRPDYPTL